jgi:thiol-disulfide isomerase/thioredoxin
MRVRGSLVLTVIVAIAAVWMMRSLHNYPLHLRKNHPTSQSTSSTSSNSGRPPWADEKIEDPVDPVKLFPNFTVETYAIDGNTPEELEASLAARGPGNLGAEAKTSYQLVLNKGSSADSRCGFSNSQVQVAMTLTLPRWVVMPNVTDAAKQWWSWKLRALTEQQKIHIQDAIKEAESATHEMTQADCNSGNGLFAEINNRVQRDHPPTVFPDPGSEVDFHSPGAIVEATPVTPAASAQSPGAQPRGNPAPPALYALEVRSMSGQRVSLESQRGHVVFLNFWATWCGPCRAEIPSMQRMINQFKGHDIFFACVTDETSKAVQAYIDKSQMDLPVYFGDSAASKANIQGLPTTYILKKNGDVAATYLGGAQWDTPEMANFLTYLEKQ